MERSLQLAQFLRARRARITPDDAGIVEIDRRRVPGLRREELAMLAGLSADYYTRLEQGRDYRPSQTVLDGAGGSPPARRGRHGPPLPPRRRDAIRRLT